jgi:hypothetical protein
MTAAPEGDSTEVSLCAPLAELQTAIIYNGWNGGKAEWMPLIVQVGPLATKPFIGSFTTEPPRLQSPKVESQLTITGVMGPSDSFFLIGFVDRPDRAYG